MLRSRRSSRGRGAAGGLRGATLYWGGANDPSSGESRSPCGSGRAAAPRGDPGSAGVDPEGLFKAREEGDRGCFFSTPLSSREEEEDGGGSNNSDNKE